MNIKVEAFGKDALLLKDMHQDYFSVYQFAYFTSDFSSYLKILILQNLYSELGPSKENVKKQELEASASPLASLVLWPKASY